MYTYTQTQKQADQPRRGEKKYAEWMSDNV